MLGAFFRKFLAGDGDPDAERERPLRLARDALDRNRHDEAIGHLDRLLERDPRNAEALYLRGTALVECDKARDALSDFERALAAGPPQARYHYNAAVALWKLNEMSRCQASLQAALALEPQLEAAREFLDRTELHGEHYGILLERIQRHLKPRNYLEIGTEKGFSLAMAGIETTAIGIDPNPSIAVPLGPNHRVYAETSDDFFARHDVRALLGGPIELALIDGMHLFEYALRDFINVERLGSRQSTILVHDVYPKDREGISRERKGAVWMGDVWRLIPCLKRHRPDLWIRTIAAPPSGLALIRNLDPESGLLARNLEQICEESLALDYSAIEKDRKSALNWYPNDWENVRELLDRKIT